MILDGEAMPDTLMDIVKAPWKANPSNSVVGFNDNSSAIRCSCQQALNCYAFCLSCELDERRACSLRKFATPN